MLTGRAGGFLLAVIALWAYAIFAGITALSLAGTVLLLWFFLAWILFVARMGLSRKYLRLERVLRDENGRADHLWAGLPYRVTLRITNDGRAALPFVVIVDRVPYLATRLEGHHDASGRLASGGSIELDYEVKANGAGNMRFEGAKLLISDLEGFFVFPMFARQVEEWRCLPPLADARGRVPAVKRLNILPLLGQRPHRRPGSGIELLELREYLPGDPPKRIAWKISARRDRLMTREVESEVPIRCSLFIDASDAVRVGTIGRNALSRLIEISGAVVQANGAARDLTGLCFFDEQRVLHRTRLERGRRHVHELIHQLAEHAGLFPRAGALPLARMIPLAYGLAQDLYPELLQRDINSFPWWLPILSPRPAYLGPPPARLAPHHPWGKVLFWMKRRLRDSPLGWLWTVPRRFSLGAHRLYRQRKQIAALVAGLYQMPPDAIAELLEDDDLLRDAVVRFLSEHGESIPLRLYDDQGRYAFASHAKVKVLTHALMKAVQRGKDDELFVLLVDLLENEDLEPLLGAIRVAGARHHQVMVVCPWPDGVAPPPRRQPPNRRAAAFAPSQIEGEKSKEPARRPGEPRTARTLEAILREPFDLDEILRQTTEWRLHQAYERLRQQLSRAGVMLLCARREDTVALILERMDRLRVLQRGSP